MWFRRKQKAESAEAVRQLREQALSVSAAELNIGPTGTPHGVWGVLMETGYPEGVATLVAFADGSISLYFSNGGGVIGAGGHAKVRTAADTLLSAAGQQFAAFAPAEQTALPSVGGVRFYLKTSGGLLYAEAQEEELGDGRHVLSPLFLAAHDLIAAVRESSGRS